MGYRNTLLVASAACWLIAATPGVAQTWTPAFTASMFKAPDKNQEVTVENATISFRLRVGAAGDKVRLNLSNQYGPSFQIGAASIRLVDGKTVPIKFGGQASVQVAAGATITTDEVKLKLKAFDVVEVSLYLPDTVKLTTIHSAPGAKTSISATGDNTRAPFEAKSKSSSRPLLARVEVLGKTAPPIVVAFGDSITDATSCTIEALPICRWGDQLARRLADAGKPHVVVTQAISGNRVLSMGTGPAAVNRFERDVLNLPGVTHLIILEGINDIGGSGRVRGDKTVEPTITAEQLIAGYQSIITRAKAKGIKVMGLTILPFKGAGYYGDEKEEIRVKVNNWIRTSGAFDAVYDMEKVMADPQDPKRLNPALQRGDNLHPDGYGESRMGQMIPLDWFK